LIDTADLQTLKRVGLFSYGSGCCSEFFSGIIGPHSKSKLYQLQKRASLDSRHELTMKEYDALLDLGLEWGFGVKNKRVDTSPYQGIYDRTMAGQGLLVLKQIIDYHREYSWS
jgi:polyketide biosynthesis 3-hydroxy-3-methylglutaryl-CoA synthase-like enzyme PksG